MADRSTGRRRRKKYFRRPELEPDHPVLPGIRNQNRPRRSNINVLGGINACKSDETTSPPESHRQLSGLPSSRWF